MKSVGLQRERVLFMILLENGILGLIGGLIGIGLGWAGALLISNLQDNLTAVVTAQSVLLATGFSLAVGLFFGIYPATRAAGLNPIDALRYE